MRTLILRASCLVTAVIAACVMPAGTASAAPPGAPANQPIVHQVPTVPLFIDGVQVDPNTITQYNGRPLYMAMQPGGSPDGHLVVFTRGADFERFVAEHGGPSNVLRQPPQPMPETGESRPSAGGTKSVACLLCMAYIHEHIFMDGKHLGVPIGWGYADLTRKRMSCFVFCNNWNDETSSATADTVRGEMLWEHIWWGGSALWIPAPYTLLDLTRFGWNDRTSSFGAY